VTAGALRKIRHGRKKPVPVRGQAILESIFGIIMFTIILTLTMSITAYLYFQQAMVTAAREGARQAALNTEIGTSATESAGIAYVRSYVIDEVKHLTGQTFDSDIATITVIPPSQSEDQTPGQRMVSVSINWQMKNPINISGFLNALGADGSAFDTIPVKAMATMRYEE
jgi:hypothetical protein